MKKLTLVIPAKNEEKRIASTLNKYGAYFSKHSAIQLKASRVSAADSANTESPQLLEILVVVNNSNDSTSLIVDKYAAKYPFISKIETPYKSGKGGAVALGFAKATGDYIGFVDADGAISPAETYKLAQFLSETANIDAVIGARSRKSKSAMGTKRSLLSKLFNLYTKILFNLPYTDTQCGVKIFRKKPAHTLARKLHNTGWAFDVNLLLLCKYLNYKVVEMPINWVEKNGSKFSVLEGLFGAFVELLGLKLLEVGHAISTFAAGNIVSQVSLDILPIKTRKNSDKKNILIMAWRDIKHPEMGGSEVYVHEIAKRLAKKHTVTIFTSQPGNLSRYDVIDGVKIVRRGGFLTVYIWAALYYHFKFRHQTDLIIDVENGIPFFTPLYTTKPKILVMHHVHKEQWFKQFSLPIASVGFLIEMLIMPVVYKLGTVVTVSPSTLEDLKSLGFADKSIYLAYNSIPVKSGAKRSKTRFPSLLYLGRVKAYKRIEIAIKALSELKKTNPKAMLRIGGTGDHIEALQKYAAKLGVEDSVEFLGFVSDRKKWELMRESWVFLMPSMKEGWGITIMEAASCGTPAVGFNVEGVRDSIRNEMTGLLAVEEKDYVRKVGRLIADKKLREGMAVTCKDWANRFSWNSSAGVYETLIATDRASTKPSESRLVSDKVYPWDLDLRAEIA